MAGEGKAEPKQRKNGRDAPRSAGAPVKKTGEFVYKDTSRYEGGYRELPLATLDPSTTELRESLGISIKEGKDANANAVSIVGPSNKDAIKDAGAAAAVSAAPPIPTVRLEVLIVRSGFGKFTCNGTGCVYTGNWENDRMTGQGKMLFPSGAAYEGNWLDNKFDGEGKYTWPDGSSFTGTWSRNQINGRGHYKDSVGTTWSGKFDNGVGEQLLYVIV